MSYSQGVNPGQFDAREAIEDLGEVRQPLDRAERLTAHRQSQMEDGVFTCVEIVDHIWPPVNEATARRVADRAREASNRADQRQQQFVADQRQAVDLHAVSGDAMLQDSGYAELQQQRPDVMPADPQQEHMANMRAIIDDVYSSQNAMMDN